MGAGTALHAVQPTVSETALFLPISHCLGEMSQGEQRSPELDRANAATILTITGLVPLFGGVLFLTAGVPNLVLSGLLFRSLRIRLSWVDWLIYNLPLWGLIPILYLVVRRWFRLSGVELPQAMTRLPRMRRAGPNHPPGDLDAGGDRGRLRAVDHRAWHHTSTGMVAVIMIVVLFLPWTGITMADHGRHIMWQVLFLIGGAISMGNLLYDSGAVTWLDGFSGADQGLGCTARSCCWCSPSPCMWLGPGCAAAGRWPPRSSR